MKKRVLRNSPYLSCTPIICSNTCQGLQVLSKLLTFSSPDCTQAHNQVQSIADIFQNSSSTVPHRLPEMDKSPYASYLHTNYPPTASEILEIKDFLTKPLARLTSIKAEIDRLNPIIEKLYDEHRALNAWIEAHRALLFPLRQVPLDIMEEIFIHCLPKDHNAVMSTQEAPLLLGRVCSE